MLNKILLFCILYYSEAQEDEGKSVQDYVSKIYCKGDVLKTVQLSDIFDSSLDFINMKMRDLPEHILDKFESLDQNNENFETDLKNFLEENFEPHPPAAANLEDLKEMNSLEHYIRDEKYRNFYQAINKFWMKLAKSTTEDAKNNLQYHSMIPLPNPYIMASEESIDLPPSWRSFLIVRGLLSNEMFQIAAGIIKNYAELTKHHAFPLYSNRVYWSERSSLPFLALMAQEYIEENYKDEKFLEEVLEYVEKDFLWWYNNRREKVTKNKKEYMMFKYQNFSTDPRPENYKEDFKFANQLPPDERNNYYSVIRDLDESIFNISSRFVRPGKYSDERLNLDTINKIPVELNCILLKNVEILASWHLSFGHKTEHEIYSDIANQLAVAIEEVLYDKAEGVWLDWDLHKRQNVHKYYITNLIPLYTIIEKNGGSRTIKAINYMIKEEIISQNNEPNYFIIPTSKQKMGATWDYPHGSLLWNIFIIGGLRNSASKEGNKLGRDLAHRLIKTIHNEFEKNGNLLEHYTVAKQNAEDSKSPQETNQISASTLGCTIDLLKTFGKTARYSDYSNFEPLYKYITTVEFVEPLSPAKKLKSVEHV